MYVRKMEWEGLAMRLRWVILFFSIWVSTAVAQDTISGTYSYTYGDKESLVEARQTCKDLALREAIESYYIFVESSTDVENFQLKEDIIKSLTAGYVKNVQIVDQTEEGRTITMTVEATVSPDEVKSLVEKLVMGQQEEEVSASTESDVSESSGDESASPFLADLAEYEKRLKLTERAWEQRKYDVALNQLNEIQPLLDRHKPSSENPFQWWVYQCVTGRTTVLKNLIHVENLESEGKNVRARAARRLLLNNAGELKKHVQSLEKLSPLTDKQKVMRKAVVTRCSDTLNLVQKEMQPIGRK